MSRRDSVDFRQACLQFARALADGSPAPLLCDAPPPKAWRDRWPSHAIFTSSGSTSQPQSLLFSPASLRHAASRVNDLQEAQRSDVALIALPVQHIGGFSQLTRAALAGATVRWFDHAWEPCVFLERLRATNATLTSLVPTQLHDIVAQNLPPPHALREVLLGGAACTPELRHGAVALGWPVRETYGMTETASQVASRPSREISGEPSYDVLPGWEVRVDPAARLQVKGASLTLGRLSENGDLTPLASPDGWHSTSDLVEIRPDGRLFFQHRAGSLLKIRGIWTDPVAVRQRIEARNRSLTVVALPDARAGHHLWLVSEAATDAASLLEACADLAPPHAPFAGVIKVPSIPRSDLGKVRMPELMASLG